MSRRSPFAAALAAGRGVPLPVPRQRLWIKCVAALGVVPLAVFVMGLTGMQGAARFATCSIAGGLTAAAVVGVVLLLRSQRRDEAKLVLSRLAQEGAFAIAWDVRTPETILLSHAVARRFRIQRLSDSESIDPSALTLGDVGNWVYERLCWDASLGRLGVDHSSLQRVRGVLARHGARDGAHLATPVGSILSGRRLRAAWRALDQEFGVRLPPLEWSVPWRALALLVAIAVSGSVLFGIFKPDDGPDSYAVLGILSVACLLTIAVLGQVFPQPPPTCYWLGQLTAHLCPPDGRRETTWTPESVWAEVRDLAATAYGTPTESLVPETPLVRALGMPVVGKERGQQLRS